MANRVNRTNRKMEIKKMGGVNRHHEWIELPIQPVLDCISQSINKIKPIFDKYKYIHQRGLERWDYYKQIAHIYFDNE